MAPAKTFLMIALIQLELSDALSRLKFIKARGGGVIYDWSRNKGEAELHNNHSFQDEMREAEGAIVRVIADNMLPYVTSSNDSQELGGYLGEAWTIIQTALKFRTEVTSLGYDRGLEMMMKGKADVMLAAAVQKRMVCCVTYSQPYYYNWYHLYMKEKAVASSRSYLYTLNQQLWNASFLLLTILAAFLWISLWIGYRWCGIKRRVSLPTCILIVCSGFLNQGYDMRIRSMSARMQMINAIIFGYLLYTAMNAVLVSQLANYTVLLPFLDLEELALGRSHSLCVRTNSFVYNNFTDENRTLLAKWQGLVNGPGCLDINDQENLAKLLCDERVVILESRVVISTVVRRFRPACDIIYFKKKLFVKPNSIVILKSFPHRRLLHFYFQRMQNNGILSRLEDIWVHGTLLVAENRPPAPEVTFEHIQGLLYLFSLMIPISLMILTVEIALRYKFKGDLKE